MPPSVALSRQPLAGGSTEIQREIIAKAIFGGRTELEVARHGHLGAQQAMMVDAMRRWLDKHYRFERRQEILGARGGFDPSVWAGFAALGLTGLLVPEAAGGLGHAVADLLPLLETAGEALVPTPGLERGAGDPRPLRYRREPRATRCWPRWRAAKHAARLPATPAPTSRVRSARPTPRGVPARRRGGSTAPCW